MDWSSSRPGEPPPQDAFFDATFSVMGHLSKADGRVDEQEIAAAEMMMRRMGIYGDTSKRQAAMRSFRAGTAATFDLDQTLESFMHQCGHSMRYKQTFLLMLIGAALADNHLHAAERRILEHAAQGCGYSIAHFNRLLNLATAQQRFGGRWRQNAHNAHNAMQQRNIFPLSDAYKELGVKKSASNAEVTRAYRRQMSQYHPDKLVARGAPESLVEAGKQKVQKVQSAYQLIKENRNMS